MDFWEKPFRRRIHGRYGHTQVCICIEWWTWFIDNDNSTPFIVVSRSAESERLMLSSHRSKEWPSKRVMLAEPMFGRNFLPKFITHSHTPRNTEKTYFEREFDFIPKEKENIYCHLTTLSGCIYFLILYISGCDDMDATATEKKNKMKSDKSVLLSIWMDISGPYEVEWLTMNCE